MSLIYLNLIQYFYFWDITGAECSDAYDCELHFQRFPCAVGHNNYLSTCPVYVFEVGDGRGF